MCVLCMNTWRHEHMVVCINEYMYVYVTLCMSTCMYTWHHVWVHSYLHDHIYSCIFMYMYVCMHVCMFGCMNACVMSIPDYASAVMHSFCVCVFVCVCLFLLCFCHSSQSEWRKGKEWKGKESKAKQSKGMEWELLCSVLYILLDTCLARSSTSTNNERSQPPPHPISNPGCKRFLLLSNCFFGCSGNLCATFLK